MPAGYGCPIALTGRHWGSAKFDAFDTHPRVSLQPSLGAQAAHALLVPAEVESDILRRVRTLLRELDGHHPACQRDRGEPLGQPHPPGIYQPVSAGPLLGHTLLSSLLGSQLQSLRCRGGE